jgi:glycosyltransferase involved in cell wall biosynthesis
MHIGLDISVLRIAQAGVFVYTRHLIEQLVAQGTEHHWTLLDVLPLNPDRPMPVNLEAFAAPNVRVVRCPGLNRRYLSMHPAARQGMLHPVARQLDHALDHPWALAATATMGMQLRLALHNVDVFHSSDQFLHAPGHAAAILPILDLTTRIHPEFHIQANTAMHTAKERFAMTRADHIVTISQATRRDIIAHLHIPAERISVTYPAKEARFRPYPAEQIQPLLDRYRLQVGQYILHIGTLEPRKNHIRLIEGYALLRHQLATQGNEPPPLVLGGGHGWLYDEILTAPARYGVAQHVRFLGKIPDAELPLLLAGAGLFVYPSLYEGFGLPVLEALACGVPVVAANSTSIPEVLGEAGVYCDPHDSATIAQGMAAVLANPVLADELRCKGIAQAAHFSWERMAQETLAVYAQADEVRRKRRQTLMA